MNTSINLDRLLIDVTPEAETIVTLLYSSDEPAHPVWGGGVKQKTFPASVRTEQILPLVFGDTGLSYIQWPDAPAAVAHWFRQQPGVPSSTEWRRFDRTPPEAAAIVAKARQAFGRGMQTGLNKVEVPVPAEARLPVSDEDPPQQLGYTVTFQRHDPVAPWVAVQVQPMPC